MGGPNKGDTKETQDGENGFSVITLICKLFRNHTSFVLTKSLRATMPVYMPPYAANVAFFPMGEGPPLPLQVCAALFNTTLMKKDTYTLY